LEFSTQLRHLVSWQPHWKSFTASYQLISIYLFKVFDCPICKKNAISSSFQHDTPTIPQGQGERIWLMLFLKQNLNRECT